MTTTNWISITGIFVTLIIAVVGWIVTWRKTKEINKQTKLETEESLKARDEDLSNMRVQIQALQQQASALNRQTALNEARSNVPSWNLTKVRGKQFAVTNGNTYIAKNVRIQFAFDGENKQYDLGDIAPGSSQTFTFREQAIWGAPDQVEITWQVDDSDREMQVSVPVR